MAESLFAKREVNLRSVTYNAIRTKIFKENAYFGALNLFTSEKKRLNKVIRQLIRPCQPLGLGC